MSEREVLAFDVLIVGAGPAGLSAAIRLKQLAQKDNREIAVCVVEKGSEVGAHILSGAVLEPRALDELIPDWKAKGAPVTTAATSDSFWFLTAKRKWRLPTPPPMKNHGNYIISLGKLTRWLGAQAEALGADIFPGFAAAETLYENGRVAGVATGDMGVRKDGGKGPNYAAGVELRAKYTLFAEGCRGSLSEEIIAKHGLRAAPQTYGVGIKELWEIPEQSSRPGEVVHSVGWPLDRATYGGSFIYHLARGKLAIGFVVGLDYRNPHLSPYREFQRFKRHPAIAAMLAGGRRVAYGARALNEGGWQAVPRLAFPGGLLVGCAAGFLNVPKIKGTHTAMKSGMLAAESVYRALSDSAAPAALDDYQRALSESWIGEELKRARNIRPAFRRGLWAGMLYAAVDAYLLRGRAPWTFRHHPDHESLREAARARPIAYPKNDGKLGFDRLENLAFAGVAHEENQPCHLRLREPARAIEVNWRRYAAPETLYCPAGVYEIVRENGAPRLQINAANCVHCKTCDIKDPTQNIRWTPPEGGGGPNYAEM